MSKGPQFTHSLIPYRDWPSRDCAICGRRFYRPQGRISKAKFCCHPCYAVHRSRNVRGYKQSAATRAVLSQQKLGEKNPQYGRRGCLNSKWKGGVSQDRRGYRTRTSNRQSEHRFVAEFVMGIKLGPGMVVHHIDHNKSNNDPKNLMVMTRAEHARLHMRERYESNKHSRTA